MRLPSPISLVHARACSLALALILGGAAIAPAAAQTSLFPRTPTDVATYKTVEECLAAATRLYQSAERRELLAEHLAGRWRDTLPYDPRRDDAWQQPLPDTAVVTVRRCSTGRAAADTAFPHYSMNDLMQLYLSANRDADATALVASRMVAVPSTDTATRRIVEDSALQAYARAQPFRRAAIEQIQQDRLRRAATRFERIGVHFELAQAALRVFDTATAVTHAKQVLAESESPLTEAERSLFQQTRKGGILPVMKALQLLNREVLYDSLRVGTATYVAALRTLWRPLQDRMAALNGTAGAERQRTKPPAEVGILGDLNLRGKPAPPVTADFWFRRGSAGGDSLPHPTPGKVGLVVYVDPLDSLGSGYNEQDLCLRVKETMEDRASGGCRGSLAVVRRLAQRFPELDITLVAQTRGYFIYQALPDSAVTEAEFLRRWLLESERLPGTLAVQTTKALRLPDPDGRRLLQPGVLPTRGMSLVVDREGLVVHQAQLGRLSEDEFTRTIDAVMQRPLARSPAKAPS